MLVCTSWRYPPNHVNATRTPLAVAALRRAEIARYALNLQHKRRPPHGAAMTQTAPRGGSGGVAQVVASQPPSHVARSLTVELHPLPPA